MNTDYLNESLQQATHDAGFLSRHLHEAHSRACKDERNAVTQVYLLQLLQRARELERAITELQGAHEAATATINA